MISVVAMKITVLYSRVTGYVEACLEALAAEKNSVQLQVFRWPSSDNAPFDLGDLDWIEELHVKDDQDASEIKRTVRSFSPDAVLMSGWIDDAYVQAARSLRGDGTPVVAGCDTQWTGSLRQQAGRLAAPWYLHSAIDVLWVPGERQRQLAQKLGYTGSSCWTGYYSCDWSHFAEVYSEKITTEPSFLYVGRYVEEKGVDVLTDAYRAYRAHVEEPWPLVTAGAGPLEDLLEETDGVENRGFVQPDRLPTLMTEAGAFVLPSRFEPWGVVVQEAAAAGVPVLCSTASGAGVHLVQDGYNGYQIEVNDAQHLAQCMEQMSSMSDAERARMGARSHELSKQFTPERWARTFVEGIQRLNTRSG